jgi:hypothetical protein
MEGLEFEVRKNLNPVSLVRSAELKLDPFILLLVSNAGQFDSRPQQTLDNMLHTQVIGVWHFFCSRFRTICRAVPQIWGEHRSANCVISRAARVNNFDMIHMIPEFTEV